MRPEPLVWFPGEISFVRCFARSSHESNKVSKLPKVEWNQFVKVEFFDQSCLADAKAIVRRVYQGKELRFGN